LREGIRQIAFSNALTEIKAALIFCSWAVKPGRLGWSCRRALRE